VRLHEFITATNIDPVTKVVADGANGFASVLLSLTGIMLDAKDLLVRADAAKSLVETSEKFLKTVTTDQFYKDLTAIVGQPGANPLGGIGGLIDSVAQIANKVPGPQDLAVIGNELYRLLCVEQLPLDEAGLSSDTETHLNLDNTGKVRLIQWSLNKPITIPELGKEGKEKSDSSRLGSRRVWLAGNDQLPKNVTLLWREPDKTEGGEVVYQFNFTGDQQGSDIKEANDSDSERVREKYF